MNDLDKDLLISHLNQENQSLRAQLNREDLDELWADAQNYEFAYWESFMRDRQEQAAMPFAEGLDYILRYFKNRCRELPRISHHYVNSDLNLWQRVLSDAQDKVCLELGTGGRGLLPMLWPAKKRIAIDPLFDKIDAFQKAKFGKSVFQYTQGFALRGERHLKALTNSVDGIVICHNALDHSPFWPFILSNMASYNTSGSRLLLWTDIYHPGGSGVGHFDITKDTDSFLRLIENLNYKIEISFVDKQRANINIGVYATKL